VARVTKVRVYPNFKKTTALAGGVFQGSMSGVTYTTLATITGRVQESWTEIDVNTTQNYRFLRFVGPASGLCEVGGGSVPFVPGVCGCGQPRVCACLCVCVCVVTGGGGGGGNGCWVVILV
jgi:hypothetical protein